MKIQAGLFLNNAKKLTKIIKSRTEKNNTKTKNDIKKDIIKKGSKILNLRSTQNLLQAEISKRQHIIDGLKKIRKEVSVNSQNNIRDKVAKVLSEYDYGGEYILNSYIKDNINSESINSNFNNDKFYLEISKLEDVLSKEISSFTENLDRLFISENNILSLNDINQEKFLSLLKDIKSDITNKDNIYNFITNDDIDNLLIK